MVTGVNSSDANVSLLLAENPQTLPKFNANRCSFSKNRVLAVAALAMGLALWALGLVAIANENRVIQGLGGASMVGGFASIVTYVIILNKS